MSNSLPIIFVHGWGGPKDLIRDFGPSDECDPYVGWNMGHRYNDSPDDWIKYSAEQNFEGQVLRLIKDFDYYDACNDEKLENLRKFLKPEDNIQDVCDKSLWIFRYYEYNADHRRLSSNAKNQLVGELKKCGYRDENLNEDNLAGVPYYAALLAIRIQQIACADCHRLVYGSDAWDLQPAQDGLNLGRKVALVGHSMGGLIARFALQYNLFGVAQNVARLMTMATPHGGARIDMAASLLKLLPTMRNDDIQFFTPDWVNTHLGGQIPKPPLPITLERSDVFCLVGTRNDLVSGIRLLPHSDGAVNQDEAYLKEYPYAYVYNTHQGEHGIRENQAGYEALRRFLFGDLHVKLSITHIERSTGSQKNLSYSNETKFFFQYFVKPHGINAYLNEISERANNQPQPRTLAELQERLQTKPYIIYDGFADPSALVKGNGARDILSEPDRQFPHLQLDHNSFRFDPRVGGQPVGSGSDMIKLTKGTQTMCIVDETFQAELEVVVTERDD